MKTLIARTSLAVAGIALAAAAVALLPERLAQAQAPPHFDVATIKPTDTTNGIRDAGIKILPRRQACHSRASAKDFDYGSV